MQNERLYYNWYDFLEEYRRNNEPSDEESLALAIGREAGFFYLGIKSVVMNDFIAVQLTKEFIAAFRSDDGGEEVDILE